MEPDLPTSRTRVLLHHLVGIHRLVTKLQNVDDPVLGPRFGAKTAR